MDDLDSYLFRCYEVLQEQPIEDAELCACAKFQEVNQPIKGDE